MRDLWELRQTRRPDVVWWCAAHLLRATRSNAGLRLICPGEVARWRAVSRQLSPRRWSLHLEGPPGACDRSQWEAACPVATPWRCKAGSKSVAAIIRLPRPDSEDPDSRLREISADYASGAPVFAAHGIAIALKLSAKDMALELRRPNEPGH